MDQIGRGALEEVIFLVGDLVCAEEHLAEVGMVAEAQFVRTIRTHVMRRFLTDDPKIWCAVKHLCSAIEHLTEISEMTGLNLKDEISAVKGALFKLLEKVKAEKAEENRE